MDEERFLFYLKIKNGSREIALRFLTVQTLVNLFGNYTVHSSLYMVM